MDAAESRLASIYETHESLIFAITHAIVRRVDALQTALRSLPPTAYALQVVDAEGRVVLKVAAPTNEAWNRCVDKVQTFRNVDPGLDALFDARNEVDTAYQEFVQSVQLQNEVLARMEAEVRSTPTDVGYTVQSRRQGTMDPETLKQNAILDAYANQLTRCASGLRDATDALEHTLKQYEVIADGRLPGWGDDGIDNVDLDPWTMTESRIRHSLVSLEMRIVPVRFQLQDLAESIQRTAKISTAAERLTTTVRLAHAHSTLSLDFQNAPPGSEAEESAARELVHVRKVAWPFLKEAAGIPEDEEVWDSFGASDTDVRTSEESKALTLHEWKCYEDDAQTLLQASGFHYYLLQTMIDLHCHLLVAKSIAYLKPAQPHSPETILSALLNLADIKWSQSCRPEHVSRDCINRVLYWFARAHKDETYATHEIRCQTSFLELDCNESLIKEVAQTRATLPSLHDAAAALLGRFKVRSVLNY